MIKKKKCSALILFFFFTVKQYASYYESYIELQQNIETENTEISVYFALIL